MVRVMNIPVVIYYSISLLYVSFIKWYFQFGFQVFQEIRNFNVTYRCFSVSMLPGNERQDVERGGKSKRSGFHSSTLLLTRT